MTRQQRIYDYIKTFIETHGYSPTLKEMSAACHISESALRNHLGELEALGKIRREAWKWRGIYLTDYQPKKPTYPPPTPIIKSAVIGLPEGSWMPPKPQKKRKVSRAKA